jgi:phospholipid-binding lipoprotein MlaA
MRSLLAKAVLLAALVIQLAPNAWAKPEDEIWDPLEPINRKIFWFNDKFDVYLLEPIAKGYDYVTPQRVQTGISNFFSNIRYPVYLLSDLIQFDFTNAARDTGRFLINSTAGILGFVDVAKCVGLKPDEKDFGVALASHDIPPGPYIVLPFLGPSNLRDGIGRAVDLAIYPTQYPTYFGGMSYYDQYAVSWGSRGVDIVNERSALLDPIKAAKENSFDYYLFMQGAYYQYRRGLLYHGNPPLEEDEEEPEIGAEKGASGAPPAKSVFSPAPK